MLKFENDLTKGNVAKQLIIFALPFIISNFIQSLYGAVDLLIVGNYAKDSLAGVNNGTQLTILITNAVVGLTVGATVLVGQYIAQGKKEAVQKTIGTMFTVLLVLAVLISVLTPFIADPLLKLIKVSDASYGEAYSYFFTVMMGTIFVFAYNALAAIMRGMGDSKNPLIFVAIAAAVNIILDILFVKELGMKAFGAAIATVIAQAVSVILCIIYLKRRGFIFDFKISSFKIEKSKLFLLLKIGFPTMINNLTISTSFLFLMSMANRMGDSEAEAVGVVGKLNGFAILPAIAISSAISAMVAQNFSVGKYDRVLKTFRTGLLLSLVFGSAVLILVRTFPEALVRLFSNEDDFIEKSVVYLKSISWDYLITPFVFSFNGLFIGAGHTLVSLTGGVMSSLAFRIPACYLLSVTFDFGLRGLGFGAPIASLASAVFLFIYFLSGKWKVDVIKK